MANLNSLYQIRCKKGRARQPSHAATIIKFANALGANGIFCPYDKTKQSKTFWDILNSFNEFKGSKGKAVVIAECEYVYRFTTAADLADSFGENNWILKHLPLPHTRSNKDDFNRRFFSYAEKNWNINDWIELSSIIQKEDPVTKLPVTYKNRRQFSFWTTSELDAGNPLTNTFKIGYATDWIQEHTLVLRCKVKKLNSKTKIRIPTIIDAFTEPIFRPTKDSSKNTWGLAIDICVNPLDTGFKEFVIDEIEVEKIEFKPVNIEDMSTNGIKFNNGLNANLVDNLEYYYTNNI